MKVFLAGDGWEKLWLEKGFFDFYRLNTFFYLKEKEILVLSKYKGFLLDSGAFTFFGNTKVSINEYVDSYIAFINKHNIEHFFELDLYTVPEYGTTKTEELRAYIEQKTGKQTIPVFHHICGIDYFKTLCKNYKYIAISASGLYDSKWTRTNPEKLKAMVLYANSKGVKVHGLGYTKLDMLSSIPFYSVDSATWISGNRFGAIYVFNGAGLSKTKKPVGMRVKCNETGRHNFYEWIKFQKYADEKF